MWREQNPTWAKPESDINAIAKRAGVAPGELMRLAYQGLGKAPDYTSALSKLQQQRPAVAPVAAPARSAVMTAGLSMGLPSVAAPRRPLGATGAMGVPRSAVSPVNAARLASVPAGFRPGAPRPAATTGPLGVPKPAAAPAGYNPLTGAWGVPRRATTPVDPALLAQVPAGFNPASEQARTTRARFAEGYGPMGVPKDATLRAIRDAQENPPGSLNQRMREPGGFNAVEAALREMGGLQGDLEEHGRVLQPLREERDVSEAFVREEEQRIMQNPDTMRDMMLVVGDELGIPEDVMSAAAFGGLWDPGMTMAEYVAAMQGAPSEAEQASAIAGGTATGVGATSIAELADLAGVDDNAANARVMSPDWGPALSVAQSYDPEDYEYEDIDDYLRSEGIDDPVTIKLLKAAVGA